MPAETPTHHSAAKTANPARSFRIEHPPWAPRGHGTMSVRVAHDLAMLQRFISGGKKYRIAIYVAT
jgi:hypothetical protein